MQQRPLNILTVFGTRPEVIKLFPVIDKLKNDEDFRCTVISTSQHREMIDGLLDLFSIKIDHDLNIMRDNQSLLDISTRTISGLDPLFRRYQPDMILVQGDTTTAFIAALAAFYLKIPVGHVEAGLRSFDRMHPYPEEINRRMISLVCDLHFAPTAQNSECLYREGIDSGKVFITGNTVIDSLLHVANQERGVFAEYLSPVILDANRMILVTAHRRENWGEPLENLCYALKDLAGAYSDLLIVYPVHLNPNVRKTVFTILGNQERIHLLDPLPYELFVKAMVRSHLIITDSGGIQEEGPSLRKPILVFRKVTERPEGLTTGGVKLIGLERESVVREASRLLDDQEAYQKTTANGNPYGDGRAAERIIQAIQYHFGRAERPEDFVYHPASSAQG
jgi:UDP-N-acetylglucosamine 2-epimerase (non-hydrolysing)